MLFFRRIIRPARAGQAYQSAWKRVNKLVRTGLLGWCVAAIACTAPPPVAPPGSLVIGFETAPTTLDPRYATDEKSSLIGDLLYHGLTRLDQHGNRVPDLAASWHLPDPTRYIFHLRRDFMFHDGSPVTAADVKATYESVLDPARASPKRESLRAIERIDVPSDDTVVFTLREPFAPFLDSTGLGILPARVLASTPRNVTIGCGPFRLARFVRDTEIVLVRVDRHPDGEPKLPGLVFKIVPDDTVRALELSRGTLHLVQNAVDPDTLRWLRRHEHLSIVAVPGTTFHYLGLNLRDPRLGIREVRQAIAHAVDREGIIEYLLKGYAVPATGLLSPAHWAYAADVATYGYDPERARALLDAAGFPDPDGSGSLPRFRLVYKGSNLLIRRRFAEVFQEQLARVGIALELRTYEWGTLYADIRRGNFQIYALAWVGVSDPDIYHSLFHSSMMPPRGNNRGGYVDPATDRLAERGRRTLDPQRRRQAYVALQQRLADLLPIIPLWWTPTVVVQSRRLQGFVPHAHGSLRSLKDAWLAPG